MAKVKSTKRQSKIVHMTKVQRFVSTAKEWKEVIAICISAGALIYTIVSYKVSIESSLNNKITEKEARVLIHAENADMKEDIKIIKEILLKGK